MTSKKIFLMSTMQRFQNLCNKYDQSYVFVKSFYALSIKSVLHPDFTVCHAQFIFYTLFFKLKFDTSSSQANSVSENISCIYAYRLITFPF